MTEELNRKEALKNGFPLLLMLGIIGLISLLIGIGASYLRHQENTSSLSAEIYQGFLNNTWNDPSGSAIDTGTWKNKTLVINFWASWCPPCVEEMPLLTKLNSEVNPSQTKVIGIGIDSPSNIREFLAKTPVPYQIAVGGLEGSRWGKELGNTQGALPFTVVIGPTGSVLFSKLGKLTEDDVNNSILKKIP